MCLRVERLALERGEIRGFIHGRGIRFHQVLAIFRGNCVSQHFPVFSSFPVVHGPPLAGQNLDFLGTLVVWVWSSGRLGGLAVQRSAGEI